MKKILFALLLIASFISTTQAGPNQTAGHHKSGTFSGAAAGLMGGGQAEFGRLWKVNDKEIRAEFLSTKGPMVRLRTEDGKIVGVDLRKLSQEDRTWIKQKIQKKKENTGMFSSGK